jgi:hypothetical protein
VECSIASTRACREKGGINTRVGIGAKIDIKASFSKDIFRLS